MRCPIRNISTLRAFLALAALDDHRGRELFGTTIWWILPIRSPPNRSSQKRPTTWLSTVKSLIQPPLEAHEKWKILKNSWRCWPILPMGVSAAKPPARPISSLGRHRQESKIFLFLAGILYQGFYNSCQYLCLCNWMKFFRFVGPAKGRDRRCVRLCLSTQQAAYRVWSAERRAGRKLCRLLCRFGQFKNFAWRCRPRLPMGRAGSLGRHRRKGAEWIELIFSFWRQLRLGYMRLSSNSSMHIEDASQDCRWGLSASAAADTPHRQSWPTSSRTFRLRRAICGSTKRSRRPPMRRAFIRTWTRANRRRKARCTRF